MKRNLLRIPATILERVRAFDQDNVIASTVKSVLPEDVDKFSHLGLHTQEGKLFVPEPSPPPATSGRYSNANLFGMVKVRKDLPKTTKEFGFWAPSWGSGSYHYVSNEREVYQREFFSPKEVALSIELIEERAGAYILKFAVDQVLDRTAPNFELELLYNLNLLQENVGSADVFKSSTSADEFAATVQVNWRILPPGTVDEVMSAILQGKGKVTAEQQTVMKDRIEVLSKLKPEAYIAGADGFLRYFGAKFGDDFVVFENVRYGNAIYVMYEDWKTLSQKSRIDLLAGDPDAFDRIVHKEGWNRQLQEMVRSYRQKKRRMGGH
jgi:hypothetical protein